MKNRLTSSLVALAFLLSCVGFADADADVVVDDVPSVVAVYNVDRTADTEAVSGTISVSSLGSLTASDIADYSLVFSGANQPDFTLKPANSGITFFGDVLLTASATDLQIDLNGGIFGFSDSVAFPVIVSYQLQEDVREAITLDGDPNFDVDQGINSLPSGTVISLPNAVAVPEPSSLAAILFAAGLVSHRRRKKILA